MDIPGENPSPRVFVVGGINPYDSALGLQFLTSLTRYKSDCLVKTLPMHPRHIVFVLLLFLPAGHFVSADQMQPATPFVMGYASQLSCAPGEEISFHLSSSGRTVDLKIDRVGAEREFVLEQVDVGCEQHPIPDRASSHGCMWPAAFTLRIPDDWKSGYYEATLTTSSDDQTVDSTLFFVVRSATPGSQTGIRVS